MSLAAARPRRLNEAPVAEGPVLYLMTAHRRTRANFALEHALDRARTLARPLLVVEVLGLGRPHTSDRTHHFVLDGMRDNRARCAAAGVAYAPLVETRPGEAAGRVAAIAAGCACVVADDHPMEDAGLSDALLAGLPVTAERVDANGLVPVRAFEKAFTAAVHFRRAWQRLLAADGLALPALDPLAGLKLPPLAASLRLDFDAETPLAGDLAGLPIDHGVPAVAGRPGGTTAGLAVLDAFLAGGLARYADERQHPDAAAASGLSPYLHAGHIGAAEVFMRVMAHVGWTPACLGQPPRGAREGWWGADRTAEAFLDELVTWRELAFNGATFLPGFATYDALPAWARDTLERHAADPRPARYDLATLAAAETDDPLWNAAQRELRATGTIHNQLRMLWGKRVLTWTGSPEEAFAVLVELNDRYALDGRDPASYAGIGWVFGRYDRPWFPERPIFGTVRMMSSVAAARKLKLARYLERWGG